MDDEELQKLLELIKQAYADAGKDIKLAVLYDEEDTEVLIDNRDDEELH